MKLSSFRSTKLIVIDDTNVEEETAKVLHANAIHDISTMKYRLDALLRYFALECHTHHSTTTAATAAGSAAAASSSSTQHQQKGRGRTNNNDKLLLQILRMIRQLCAQYSGGGDKLGLVSLFTSPFLLGVEDSGDTSAIMATTILHLLLSNGAIWSREAFDLVVGIVGENYKAWNAYVDGTPLQRATESITIIMMISTQHDADKAADLEELLYRVQQICKNCFADPTLSLPSPLETAVLRSCARCHEHNTVVLKLIETLLRYGADPNATLSRKTITDHNNHTSSNAQMPIFTKTTTVMQAATARLLNRGDDQQYLRQMVQLLASPPDHHHDVVARRLQYIGLGGVAAAARAQAMIQFDDNDDDSATTASSSSAVVVVVVKLYHCLGASCRCYPTKADILQAPCDDVVVVIGGAGEELDHLPQVLLVVAPVEESCGRRLHHRRRLGEDGHLSITTSMIIMVGDRFARQGRVRISAVTEEGLDELEDYGVVFMATRTRPQNGRLEGRGQRQCRISEAVLAYLLHAVQQLLEIRRLVSVVLR